MKLPFYVRWLLKVNPATKSSYDIIGLCFANFILQFCLKTKNTLVVLEKLPFSTLHKKWSSLWRISSVNVTKSAGNCGFSHIYWRNPSWKISFFVQWKLKFVWIHTVWWLYKHLNNETIVYFVFILLVYWHRGFVSFSLLKRTKTKFWNLISCIFVTLK